MIPSIVTIDEPNDEDRDAVLKALRAYNEAQVGPMNNLPVAILLKDEAGNSVGGLWGRTGLEWMFVEYLVVPEACRGQDIGTRLMQQAEQLARARNCTGIWLDTFSFQARGFYEKLGFSSCGEIQDYPAGHSRFFLQKRL